jgi:hypothetical protein
MLVEQQSPFKYADVIVKNKIEACPPVDATPQTRKSYRFTNGEDNPNNFMPLAHTDNPIRILHGDDVNEKLCKYYCGLSMFTSEENARNFWRSLGIKRKMSFTNIAEGAIEKTDGVCEKVRYDGHFTFYEYKETELNKKFKTISSLP